MACDGLCYAWAVRELKHKREGRAPRGLSARHEPGARVELRGRGRGAAASGFAPIGSTPLSNTVRLTRWRCAWQESNLRPCAPEAHALSPELQAREPQSTRDRARAAMRRALCGGYSTIFQKESSRTIFPSSNVQRSHPRTSSRAPSAVVPVSVRSEAPRSPLTK